MTARGRAPHPIGVWGVAGAQSAWPAHAGEKRLGLQLVPLHPLTAYLDGNSFLDQLGDERDVRIDVALAELGIGGVVQDELNAVRIEHGMDVPLIPRHALPVIEPEEVAQLVHALADPIGANVNHLEVVDDIDPVLDLESDGACLIGRRRRERNGQDHRDHKDG